VPDLGTLNPDKWIDADAYLFDIDGTLLNAYGGAHYNAFHSALKAIFHIDSKIDGVPLHGNTDIGILRAVLEREGIEPSEFDRGLDLALAHMCAEVERHRHQIRSEVCPAIPDLVRHLHSQGRLLGVASGNLERIGWLKVEAAGLRQYFSFGSFSDRAEMRADIFRVGIEEARRRVGPHASVCVIGDTPADIQAAHHNNVPIVAVATGIYSEPQLAAHAPEILLSCCTELFSAVAP
jgi:phosphoglycolate phosphatase-like HAD superfamily hydrolase